jgi:hypothetical protein
MSPVVALFRGPAHVLVEANEEALALFPPEALGMPVSEAFPQETYREVQEVMDAVFGDGLPRVVRRPEGEITVSRLEDRHGHRWGVGTHFVVRSRQSLRVLPGLQPTRYEQVASHLRGR